MGLIDQMMANFYKPPKPEKPNTVLPKSLTPAKVANMMNQTTVSQGQLLKGQVLDLRANQIQVLLENGITVSARTEGTLELSIGQTAKFLVAQTTEEQILLKLAKEDTPAENPMIDKALSAANIQKTERSVSIVTELLNHQQPANEAGIRHYLSLSAKYPEIPVKNLILMELHHIPVTKENVKQFVNYQDRNAKLLNQAQDMLQSLSDTLENLPESPLKQELLQEFRQILGVENTSGTVTDTVTDPTQNTTGSNTTESIHINSSENISTYDVELGKQSDTQPTIANNSVLNANHFASNTADTTTVLHTAIRTTHTDTELLLRDFLDTFLFKPEEVAEPEKVQKYYEKLNEKLTRLETLSQKITENTTENLSSGSPKEMRQNLSFMEAVNNVFPYIQLPLKFKETPTHGELYVYEKKKALKPTDTLSALLHLEMEALGTMDIFITLAGTHVTTRFSMTDKNSGTFVQSELPKLTEALAKKGYTLQSEVTIREPEKENTPTLLEQFLEELAPGGLNRYTFDIRA